MLTAPVVAMDFLFNHFWVGILMLTAPAVAIDLLLFDNFCFASDEAVAAFLEISGRSLTELSLNHVNKVPN